jgi:uncharacterized protein (DUF433 family)
MNWRIFMQLVKKYVDAPSDGTWRIVDTRVSLDSVVYCFRDGHSPESIVRAYPALNLEQVYGAVAFYLANRKEVDEYLERQEALYQNLRGEQDRNPDALVQRLRALSASRAEKSS